MTLGDFLSTRRWSEDLSPLTGNPDDHRMPGYVYLGCLYIESVEPGIFCLTIGNSQHLTTDLPFLERELWEWAKAEGYEVDEAQHAAEPKQGERP